MELSRGRRWNASLQMRAEALSRKEGHVGARSMTEQIPDHCKRHDSSLHMIVRPAMRFMRYRPLFVVAFVKALHNRRAPWYQRGLIRKPLRKIEVILLHDVEHRFLGKPAMVLGKQSVHGCKLFIGHGAQPERPKTKPPSGI